MSLRLPFFLLVVAISLTWGALLVGSASATDGATYPKPGHWSGKTADDYPISYKVAQNTNKVGDFKLKWNYKCDNDGSGTITLSTPAPVKVNHATGFFGFPARHFKVPGLTNDAYVELDAYFTDRGKVAKSAKGSLSTGYFYDLNNDFCVGHDASFKTTPG